MDISNPESQFYPFPERPGINIKAWLEIMDSEPGRLSEKEQEIVYRYEEQLTRGDNLDDAKEEKVIGLENVWRTKIKSTVFFPEYFLTPEGQKSFIEVFGVETSFQNQEEVIRFLCQADYPPSSEKFAREIKKLSQESRDYAEDRVVAQFGKNNFQSIENINIPSKIIIIRNPEDFAEKIVGYRRLKNYHRQEARQLKEAIAKAIAENQPPSLFQAKLAVLNIHRRRLNQLIAQIYPDAQIFLNQEDKVNKHPKLVKIIKENLVLIEPHEDQCDAQRLITKMDHFSWGVGQRSDKGDYNVISPEVEKLAREDQKSLTKKPEKKGSSTTEINQIRVDAKQWQQWAEKFLESQGILSRQTSYNPDREEPAGDDRWQVVITPEPNLSVNKKQKVVKVPENFDRPLIDPVTGDAIPILNHELAHVVQLENLSRTSLTIFEHIGDDRASAFLEGGAIAWERKAKKIFNQERAINFQYLEAIKTRLKGGSYLDCFQAFFNSWMEHYPDYDKKRAAKRAANRATRLFHGGNLTDQGSYLSSSKSLIYLEQQIIADELKKSGQENLLMAGVRLQTLAELHQAGLLNLSDLTIPEKTPVELIENEIASLVNQIAS